MREGWLTIGIEEEFQIVDAQGQLRSNIDTLLAAAEPILGDQVKAEMMKSAVEIGTRICANIEDARQEIVRLRGALASLLRPEGLRIASAGTHPFSHWQEQEITDKDRYKMLEQELQDVVRQLLIFGMHVHIGLPQPDQRIEIMNEARYFLPHLLALSTSSPFWLTRNTGLKSYRSIIWSRFPRTGIPPEFPSYDEFENFVEVLVRTRSIPDGSKIWWDLRPHYLYPTLEFRICDAATRIEETLCIAALTQAICAKLLRLRERNLGFRKYVPNLIQENKWRAARHGVDGRLIDFGKQQEVPMRELAIELLDFVDDVVDELGSREAVEYVHTILREGTSADRQLRVFQRTGHLHAVVDHVAAETVAGISAEAQPARARQPA
jgi:carboxylate-amine ligase